MSGMAAYKTRSLLFATAMALSACLNLAICAFATTLLLRYTPIYTPLDCVPMAGHWDAPHMGTERIGAAGEIAPRCENRNPYDVDFDTPRKGSVVLLPLDGSRNESEFRTIGTAELAQSRIPAGSSGGLRGLLNVSIPMAMAVELMMAGHPAQVIMQLDAQALVNINILGYSMGMTAHRHQVCGVAIRLRSPPHRPDMGRSACAGSLEELVIPPLNSTGATPFQLNVNRARLAPTEMKKDILLGAVMALSGILALLSVRAMIKSLRRLSKEARCVDDGSTNRDSGCEFNMEEIPVDFSFPRIGLNHGEPGGLITNIGKVSSPLKKGKLDSSSTDVSLGVSPSCLDAEMSPSDDPELGMSPGPSEVNTATL